SSYRCCSADAAAGSAPRHTSRYRAWSDRTFRRDGNKEDQLGAHTYNFYDPVKCICQAWDGQIAPKVIFEGPMDGKARFVFPIVITAVIVVIVSAVITFFNIGLRFDFVPRWLSAFLVGWPVAAVVAFFALPFARAATLNIIGLVERKA